MWQCGDNFFKKLPQTFERGFAFSCFDESDFWKVRGDVRIEMECTWREKREHEKGLDFMRRCDILFRKGGKFKNEEQKFSKRKYE